MLEGHKDFLRLDDKNFTPKQEDWCSRSPARRGFYEKLEQPLLLDIQRPLKLLKLYSPSRKRSLRAGMMLAMNAPKAAFGIVDVLDDPFPWAPVMQYQHPVKFSTELVLVKKEQVEVTANTGGMFILPPKTGEDVAE